MLIIIDNMRILNGIKQGFSFVMSIMIILFMGCSGSEKYDHYVVNLNGGEFVREINGQVITIRHLKTPNSVIISCGDFLNNWYKIAGGDLLYSKAGKDPVKVSAILRVLENGDIELMGSEIFVDGRENGVYKKKSHAATVVRKIDYEEEKINILQEAISHDYDWLLGTWSYSSRDSGTLEITFNEDFSCTQKYISSAISRKGDNQLGLFYIDNGVLTTQGFGGTYYLNPSRRSISFDNYVSRGYNVYEVRENMTKIANIERHMEPTDIFSQNGEVKKTDEPVNNEPSLMPDEMVSYNNDFIADFYQKYVFENGDFRSIATEICTPKLLKYLRDVYDYECLDDDCDEGYALWKFRLDNQDGPSNENRLISVETADNRPDWYTVKYLDLGLEGITMVKIVYEGNKPMLDEVLNVYKQPYPDIEDTSINRDGNENINAVNNESDNIQSTVNESANNTKNTNNEDESGRLMSNDVKEKEVKADNSEDENLAEDNEIYQVVEKMPEFPDGGMAGLMKWLSNNIQYPAKAREEGTQGRVTMQFVVNRDGSISDAQVLRGVDPYLDKEALRLINSMPKWKPGMQRGKPVRVRYSVPVNFRL